MNLSICGPHSSTMTIQILKLPGERINPGAQGSRSSELQPQNQKLQKLVLVGQVVLIGQIVQG